VQAPPSHVVRFSTSRASHYVDRYCTGFLLQRVLIDFSTSFDLVPVDACDDPLGQSRCDFALEKFNLRVE
jgi:hypothetical protein